MIYKRFFSIVVIVLVLTLVFYYIKKDTSVNYTPTAYEKELIEYFKEVALQSEYDDNPQKVIKWKEPMKLFVKKEKEYKLQMSAIKKTIEKINQLATDGFKIVLTNNIDNSNSLLYLCSKEKVAELDPNFYKVLTDGINYQISGLAYSEFSPENYILDKSIIFINSEVLIDIQESAILEEVTQSLGLAFDSEVYPNSIFYKNKEVLETVVNEYSVMDRDIIRILYHPQMESGLGPIQVEQVIMRILKSEKD